MAIVFSETDATQDILQSFVLESHSSGTPKKACLHVPKTSHRSTTQQIEYCETTERILEIQKRPKLERWIEMFRAIAYQFLL